MPPNIRTGRVGHYHIRPDGALPVAASDPCCR